MSPKLMFLNVQIDSYFAHHVIFAQPSARKQAFFAHFSCAKIKGAQKLKVLKHKFVSTMSLRSQPVPKSLKIKIFSSRKSYQVIYYYGKMFVKKCQNIRIVTKHLPTISILLKEFMKNVTLSKKHINIFFLKFERRGWKTYTSSI